MNNEFSKPMIKILALGLLALLAGSLAAADKPLLMEGKRTLYQRVLSIPDARLYQAPDDRKVTGRSRIRLVLASPMSWMSSLNRFEEAGTTWTPAMKALVCTLPSPILMVFDSAAKPSWSI